MRGALDKRLSNAVNVLKGGYACIYCTNESDETVYWDNFMLTHEHSPVLEETHYCPGGLVMSGISSKALNGAPENKRKYNKDSELESKEFSDGSGLELYSTFYRSLDAQLGRFWQIDPKPDYSQSLYSSMNNNPISFSDPLRDTVRHTFRTGFLGIFGKRLQLIMLMAGIIIKVQIQLTQVKQGIIRRHFLTI